MPTQQELLNAFDEEKFLQAQVLINRLIKNGFESEDVIDAINEAIEAKFLCHDGSGGLSKS